MTRDSVPSPVRAGSPESSAVLDAALGADEAFGEGGDATYTIRQLSQMFDVTPRTLRFYESQGLLSPRRIDGARLYSATDRGRLRLILRGKRFGFSLAEIGELLDLYHIGDGQVAQLSKAIALAQEKLGVLQSRREELDGAISDLVKQIDVAQGLLAQRRLETPEGDGEDAQSPGATAQNADGSD